jgi:hypothetical protein
MPITTTRPPALQHGLHGVHEVFALARGQRLQRLDLDGDGLCRHPQGALGIEGRCRGQGGRRGSI